MKSKQKEDYLGKNLPTGSRHYRAFVGPAQKLMYLEPLKKLTKDMDPSRNRILSLQNDWKID